VSKVAFDELIHAARYRDELTADLHPATSSLPLFARKKVDPPGRCSLRVFLGFER